MRKEKTYSSSFYKNHSLSCFNRLETMLRACFLFVFFLFFISPSVAQTFTISGSIENDQGTAESDVTVTAKAGGAAGETDKTSASGRYKLELEYGKSYTIEITKSGFPKRFFVVDLSNVKEESLSSGEDFASLRVSMIPNTPGVDLSALSSQPITTFSFDKKSGIMSKDSKQESASSKLEQDIKTKKEKADSGGGVNIEELQKQLNDKLKIGDLAMTDEDYDKAEKAFLDAADFAGKNSLDDTEAINKLEIAETENRKKKEAEIIEKQENEAFFKLLDEAKKLEVKKDFTKALEKLEEAKVMKPDHKELNELLTKVNDAIVAKAAEEKLNADYQQAMTDGNQFFEEKSFAEAIKKYEEAKALKPGEKDPPLKITAAQSKLKDQQKDEEKSAKFESLLLEANTAKDAEKYDEAIKKYEEAQLLIKERPEPKEGIDFCKQKKKELEDLAKNEAEQAKRDADYAASITKADALFNADKFTEAIKEYDIAAKLKDEEEYPKTQIAAANDKITELASAEERQKQFEQLKKDGEKAFGQKQLSEAKDKFTQANSIIEGDAFVLEK
jgi:tetratricopeptide (TPR) repeat protein